MTDIAQALRRRPEITPLDSRGSVVLKDGAYQRFTGFAQGHPDSMATVLFENYRHWLMAFGAPEDPLTERSTTRYDTVAIHLAIETELLPLEILPGRSTVLVIHPGCRRPCLTGTIP